MSADPSKTAAEDLGDAPTAEEVVGQAQRSIKDALAAAEKSLNEASKAAEKIIKESVDSLRTHAKAYTGADAPSMEEAQRYFVERVKERPVTAAFAGVGVGLILGVLLSSRGK